MVALSKKLFFILYVGLPFIVVAKEIKRTRKLQIIINPADPSYFFYLNNNDGNGIINNPGAPRVAGSYFLTNGFILPGGTVSKKQSSYLVDKHGHSINFSKDSIGMFYTLETMVQTLDFMSFPPKGTILEWSNWRLQFKHDCGDSVNNLFADGFAKMGTFSIGEGQAVFSFTLLINGGLGCNENMQGNSATAKVYVSANGESSLIKVKFDRPIEYKD